MIQRARTLLVSRWPLALTVAILAVRLLCLGQAPLLDTTEGRYAEIGREMATSGNWITPTLHDGIPFWGKPPLQFWLTAISFRLFGYSEAAARLPSFLAACWILFVLHATARRIASVTVADLAVLCLGSAGLFYALAGAVLLDVVFTATVVGAGCAVVTAIRDGADDLLPRRWFTYLGLALLAKGPVGLILITLPLGLWGLTSGWRWLRTARWSRLGLTLAVAAPWYILAERATPGFLHYFFVNEHILRYLRPNYGDLYGKGHVAPYGSIWPVALISLLPWTPLVIAAGVRAVRSRLADVAARERGALVFLWAWALATPVFFTLSRSLSVPYILPALPPLAILAGHHLSRTPPSVATLRRWASIAVLGLAGVGLAVAWKFALPPWQALAIVVVLVSPAAALVGGWAGRRSEGALASAALLVPALVTAFTLVGADEVGGLRSTRSIRDAIGPLGPRRVHFYDGVPPSAEFYFPGVTTDLRGQLHGQELSDGDLLLVRNDQLARIGAAEQTHLSATGTAGRYSIFSLTGAGRR